MCNYVHLESFVVLWLMMILLVKLLLARQTGNAAHKYSHNYAKTKL